MRWAERAMQIVQQTEYRAEAGRNCAERIQAMHTVAQFSELVDKINEQAARIKNNEKRLTFLQNKFDRLQFSPRVPTLNCNSPGFGFNGLKCPKFLNSSSILSSSTSYSSQ